MSASSALIALLVLAVAVPPAVARENRVFVDPDSPAGTEYAVPLEQARQEATGTSGAGAAGAGGDQPLFGVGIEPSSSGGARGAKGSGVAGGGGSDGGNQSGPGEAAPDDQSAAAIEAAASGGTSTGLLTAGIAVAVLMLGLLGGLGLRRALRDG